MRDYGNPLHLNWPALRATGHRASGARTGASGAMSDRPLPPAARWRILNQVRQVAEIARTHTFARQLCTGLSTDFLDNRARTLRMEYA